MSKLAKKMYMTEPNCIPGELDAVPDAPESDFRANSMFFL